MLSIGSLFTGIGGLEHGLAMVGLGPVKWQVEIKDFPTKVLEARFPHTPRFRDVTQVGRHNLEPVDILCGGFPCQDVSVAGNMRGLLRGNRTGLWFEMERLIEELSPTFVLGENVSGLVGRGLDDVVSGLDRLGYAVEATLIEAAHVGSPHRRERILIVAHRRSLGSSLVEKRNSEEGDVGLQPGHDDLRRFDLGRALGLLGLLGAGARAQPRLDRDADGVPGWMDTPWPAPRGRPQHDYEPPRLAPMGEHWHDRIEALGNAACAQQCGMVAGRRILEYLVTTRHV